MKLYELMDASFDENWFHIIDSEGKEHYVLNSDYIGGYGETMKELEPLLDCEFGEEFLLEIKKDPENPKSRVPMVYVELEPPKRKKQRKG